MSEVDRKHQRATASNLRHYCLSRSTNGRRATIAHRISSRRSIHSVMDAMAISVIRMVIIDYLPCWDSGDTGNQLLTSRPSLKRCLSRDGHFHH